MPALFPMLLRRFQKKSDQNQRIKLMDMLMKYTVFPHCLNLLHWMSKRNMPELIIEYLSQHERTRYFACGYSPLLLATTRCVNALAPYVTNPKNSDLAQGLSQATITKCFMMPNSSCIPFFASLAIQDDQLSTSMQKFEKISVNHEFKFFKFIYDGIFHWIESADFKKKKRIFHVVKSLDTLAFANPDRIDV